MVEIRCSNTSVSFYYEDYMVGKWLVELSGYRHASPVDNKTSSANMLNTGACMQTGGTCSSQLPRGQVWLSIYQPKPASRVGTAPPPTAQRKPEPGFSGFVMFIEVQSEAEKLETFIRAGG